MDTMEVNENNDLNLPPEWVNEAIWYQIMVERFRNGNPNVNPTPQSISGGTVDATPQDWKNSDWGQNWYACDNWMSDMPVDFYRAVQLRRYGGDLAGVIEKLPYLIHLGINAIYFNPLNQAPSLHKYDSSGYHHIDPYFGPDPEGDLRLISTENPVKPETWKWTKADLLFLEVVRTCHENDIRIIVDFSWNHTGHTFWAFEDIKKNREKSDFISWYEKINFDKKDKTEGFSYKSWNDISTLPELKKTDVFVDDEGLLRGSLPNDLKEHIFAVCQRWVQPVIDGTCYEGIDGMRLDVADLIPVDFWRELKRFTRNLRHDFFLIGEIWWESWPEKLKDGKPYLKGDIFDSIMHYHWFKVARMYFGKCTDAVSVVDFIGKIQEIYNGLKVEHCRALMNITASHDSPRLLTSMFNKNQYKHKCKPNEDPIYRTDLPDEQTYTLTALLLIHQFTFLGSPQIWNGDEMGMVGADDPDNRKPLIWPDLIFEEETQSGFSDYTYHFHPVFDAGTHKLIRDLTILRKSYAGLQTGDCLFYTDEIYDNPLLIYTRSTEKETLFIAINRDAQKHRLPEIAEDYSLIYRYNVLDSSLNELPPFSAIVKCKNSCL